MTCRQPKADRGGGTPLAALGYMAEPKYLKCYIATSCREAADPYLAERGFAAGVVSFAIPDYGILFRCRVSGAPIDLEFGAYFALLRFIRTRLSQEKIKAVQVHSSNPEFVFAFSGKSPHLVKDEERRRLLNEYSREFTLAVGYIPPLDNRAVLSPVDLPSVPQGAKIALSPGTPERRPAIRPFRRGVDL